MESKQNFQNKSNKGLHDAYIFLLLHLKPTQQ